MFKFLFKGLIRDRSRSLLPILVVTLGVMITVFLQAYMSGVMGDSIESTANFSTGHVKVMTRAYHDNSTQMPNDYALTDVNSLIKQLQKDFPQMLWSPRIQFGGLLDAPDSAGVTRAQGNVMGIGVRLLGSVQEIDRMDLRPKLLTGTFPTKRGDVLVSDELFRKMKLSLGDEVTLLSSGMYGDMAMYNFRVCGTLNFGIAMLDKGLMIADLADVQVALNMDDACSELLGFERNEQYNDDFATAISEKFNANHNTNADKFSPIMLPLRDMNGMQFFVAYANEMQYIIVLIFIFAMSIVLWNAGLLGGLRRYGEFGLRLAIGESKHEIYRTLVAEALLVGVIGSMIGTLVGLFFSWLLQHYGLNVGDMLKNSTVIMPTVLHARISLTTYYIGFVPGIFSTVIGAMLAGIGVYQRQTASLFKELES